ncbi:MAG: TrkA family potassium uptake protein [Nitriliruptorales bacterium]|nr:TrkA family potassium uptake protein [Nitriliruptorales bacterium]
MRIFVAGAGNIGRYLAYDLGNRGHDVTLMDLSDEALDMVPGEKIRRMTGDACSPTVLERAGVREADVVIAATGDDEDNLVVSLLARQEFAVPRVVARVNHPVNEWLFDESWGVDLAVSPPHMLTALVEEEVSSGDIVHLLKLQRGKVELVEVRLDASSPAVDRRIEELDLPGDATLVAVLREGHVVVCRGTTPLTEGDEVLAIVGEDQVEQLRKVLVGDRPGQA